MSKKYFASLGTLRAFERKHVSLKSLVRQRYEKYKFKMLKFLRNFFIFVITVELVRNLIIVWDCGIIKKETAN